MPIAPPPPGSIDAATQATATFLAKADGVLSGLAVADLVFEAVDPSLRAEWRAKGKGADCVYAGMRASRRRAGTGERPSALAAARPTSPLPTTTLTTHTPPP